MTGRQLDIGNSFQELRPDLGLARETLAAKLGTYKREYMNIAMKLLVALSTSLRPLVYFQRGA